MTDHEIVKKLIGEIRPVGESHIDTTRFENLERMVRLVDSLLFDINAIVPSKDHPAYSMSKAGKYAQIFIKDVTDAYCET